MIAKNREKIFEKIPWNYKNGSFVYQIHRYTQGVWFD